jgi:hypothetical protein
MLQNLIHNKNYDLAYATEIASWKANQNKLWSLIHNKINVGG